MNLMNDSDQDVREKSCVCFGTLIAMIGERPLQGFLNKIDKHKLKKIKESVAPETDKNTKPEEVTVQFSDITINPSEPKKEDNNTNNEKSKDTKTEDGEKTDTNKKTGTNKKPDTNKKTDKETDTKTKNETTTKTESNNGEKTENNNNPDVTIPIELITDLKDTGDWKKRLGALKGLSAIFVNPIKEKKH